MGILSALFRAWNSRAVRMLSALPGPEPIFIAGNGLDLVGKDLHTLFSRWCDQEYRREAHPGLVRFFLFNQPSLVSARPDLVRDVLLEHADDWYKNVPRAATRPVGGESVFREKGGEGWKAKRAHHPFEGAWAQRFYDGILPVVRRLTTERFESRQGRSFDLYAEMVQLSFSAFSHAVFGYELPAEAFTEHETLLREVGARGALPVAFSWNPVFWWRRRKWFARLEERLARGSLGDDATDLVSIMMREGALDPRSRLARDELGNIFAAGMKNAAIAAAATTFLLARHPEVLSGVLGELDGADALHCEREALLALPLFDRAVKESLRLYPSVAGFVREVKPGRKVLLDGIELPPRTQIFLVSWVVHRSPHVWADPERFDPSRFEREPEPGTYFPFGLGPRYCVGQDWTLLVTKAVVATLLSRWQVALDPSADFETKLVSVLTIPKREVTTSLTRREG